MRTVICVPRWSDGGRRDELWSFTEKWIRGQYPYPVYEGHHEGPGEARDAAAKSAGRWDVAIFHDADTVAHPEAVEAAVKNAVKTGCMTLAADTHMYLSPKASDRILAGEPGWFARPYSMQFRQHPCAFYAKPCSGVYAVPRSLWDKIGGYPHAGVMGDEDQIWFELCRIFSGPPQWVQDEITLHLWHPPADRSSHAAKNHVEARRNKLVWRQLHRSRGATAPARARQLLAETLGHRIPE